MRDQYQVEDIGQWVGFGNLPTSLTLPSASGNVNSQDPALSRRQRLFVFGGDAGMLRECKGACLMLRELSLGDGKRILYWEQISVIKKHYLGISST